MEQIFTPVFVFEILSTIILKSVVLLLVIHFPDLKIFDFLFLCNTCKKHKARGYQIIPQKYYEYQCDIFLLTLPHYPLVEGYIT